MKQKIAWLLLDIGEDTYELSSFTKNLLALTILTKKIPNFGNPFNRKVTQILIQYF